jgi:hypothetical protein
MATRNQRHPPAALITISLVLAFSFFGMTVSGSPLSVLAGGMALSVLFLVLWRTDEPPILLLPAVYQWLQVATRPILTVVYAEPIDSVLPTVPGSQEDLGVAALFGFAGVACLSLGMWFGAGKPGVNTGGALRLETQKWNQGFVIVLSLGAIILGHAANIFAGLTGSAYQLVLAFAGLKYVGLFAFAYWCFVNRVGYHYLVGIMAIEIVTGLTGFFADFRGPVLCVAIAAFAARPSFRATNIAIMTLVAVAILFVATFWSAIKGDYRSFVNSGTGAQVVEQPLEARLNYIYNAASEFDSSQFADGFSRLLGRLSYTEYLALTLAYVPRFAPHENGAHVSEAIVNMLMPRIFFPNKAPVPNDTDVTRRYTGLDVTSSENTSISIGYLAELYIDFGYFGAVIGALVIGGAAGTGYRVLRDYDGAPRLVTYGACAMFALSLTDFETALIKFVNGAVLAFAAALVMQRVIAPRGLTAMVERRRRMPAR